MKTFTEAMTPICVPSWTVASVALFATGSVLLGAVIAAATLVLLAAWVIR